MRKNQYVIYHNPRCSKSRSCLSLLEANPVEKNIVVVNYLKVGTINEERLLDILKMLDIKVIDLCRTGEQKFKELGLTKESPEYKIFEAMLKNPILIERPIIIKNGKKAIIGRPPEKVLKFMED